MVYVILETKIQTVSTSIHPVLNAKSIALGTFFYNFIYVGPPTMCSEETNVSVHFKIEPVMFLLYPQTR